MPDYLVEPVSPSEAKRLIAEILKTGTYRFSSHAEQEMVKDNLTTVDCVNVLRGGWVDSCDCERGTWRYRVCTNLIYVVVAFRSPTALTVVTAWGK